MGGFIQDNVRDELSSQDSFSPADGLSDEEKAIDGIVATPWQETQTGEQAKIYSEYILLDMTESAVDAAIRTRPGRHPRRTTAHTANGTRGR